MRCLQARSGATRCRPRARTGSVVLSRAMHTCARMLPECRTLKALSTQTGDACGAGSGRRTVSSWACSSLRPVAGAGALASASGIALLFSLLKPKMARWMSDGEGLGYVPWKNCARGCGRRCLHCGRSGACAGSQMSQLQMIDCRRCRQLWSEGAQPSAACKKMPARARGAG